MINMNINFMAYYDVHVHVEGIYGMLMLWKSSIVKSTNTLYIVYNIWVVIFINVPNPHLVSGHGKQSPGWGGGLVLISKPADQ